MNEKKHVDKQFEQLDKRMTLFIVWMATRLNVELLNRKLNFYYDSHSMVLKVKDIHVSYISLQMRHKNIRMWLWWCNKSKTKNTNDDSLNPFFIDEMLFGSNVYPFLCWYFRKVRANNIKSTPQMWISMKIDCKVEYRHRKPSPSLCVTLKNDEFLIFAHLMFTMILHFFPIFTTTQKKQIRWWYLFCFITFKPSAK